MDHITTFTPGNCTASAFSAPALLGASFLNIEANLVQNYSLDIPITEGLRYSQPPIEEQNETFCNITVTYTHPGQNDAIYVETWLPVHNYNGRLQAIGGGGWLAGRFQLVYAGMVGAVHDGYATVTTDAGVGGNSTVFDWALVSPGNNNLYALQNLGSVSLNDEAVIVKHLIQEYYGHPPSYSYWNGCSQGGRQGLMLAQRYPDAYDGVLAAAPAIYWSEVVLGTMWPSFYMDFTQQWPNACQLAQLTAFAIEDCDADDGFEDGIIADPAACKAKFNPAAYIGKEAECTQYNGTQRITPAAVNVARAYWNGPISSTGQQLWYGLPIDANLTTLAATNCTAEGECVGTTVSVTAWYDQAFVAKNLTADVVELDKRSHERFDYVYQSFKSQYDSLIGTHDADLGDFKKRGGKVVTYQGLADQALSPDGTLRYYKEISATVPDTSSFYRYFQVPGLGHCYGGAGGQPNHLFDALSAWVENAQAPDSSPIKVKLADGSEDDRIICAWPTKAVYLCGDEAGAKGGARCWRCDG